MADALDALRTGIDLLRGANALSQFMQEANKLKNSTPELQAKFVADNMNKGDKLGVKFEVEGPVAIARLSVKQTENFMAAYAQATEEEKTKLMGGKLKMTFDFGASAGKITGGSFTIDPRKHTSWTETAQAVEALNKSDTTNNAIKAAIATGDIEAVRGAFAGKPPAAAAPGVSAPEAPASAPEKVEPPKKRNPWDKLLDKIPKGNGAPATGGEGGSQSKADQPLDVAALTAQLGLKAPSAEALAEGSGATYGGAAKVRTGDRNVG